jgi:hypothetical protein
MKLLEKKGLFAIIEILKNENFSAFNCIGNSVIVL